MKTVQISQTEPAKFNYTLLDGDNEAARFTSRNRDPNEYMDLFRTLWIGGTPDLVALKKAVAAIEDRYPIG